MKNTKEIKAIIAAIYCINMGGENDENIRLLCDYALHRVYDSNANLFTLCCIGKSKEQILQEVEQVLEQETKFKEFKEMKNAT